MCTSQDSFMKVDGGNQPESFRVDNLGVADGSLILPNNTYETSAESVSDSCPNTMLGGMNMCEYNERVLIGESTREASSHMEDVCFESNELARENGPAHELARVNNSAHEPARAHEKISDARIHSRAELSSEQDKLLKRSSRSIGEQANNTPEAMGNYEQVYIGETARTLRQRSTEHWNKARLWGLNSFIIRHWMTHHGTQTEPPGFKFKVLKKFKEPLGRQILEALMIIDSGTMNMKQEFGATHLCRLESSKPTWLHEKEVEE